MIDIDSAKEFLHYDPDTGAFTWVKRRGPRAAAGSRAGHRHYSGYRNISLNGRQHMEHRLAWLFVFGAWPSDQLDHVNGIRDDNRMSNLREVSNQSNSRNQAIPRNNKSGVIGVHWHTSRGKWKADIKVNGKKITIGRFEDFFDAIAARKSAESHYGFHENHGRDAKEVYPTW